MKNPRPNRSPALLSSSDQIVKPQQLPSLEATRLSDAQDTFLHDITFLRILDTSDIITQEKTNPFTNSAYLDYTLGGSHGNSHTHRITYKQPLELTRPAKHTQSANTVLSEIAQEIPVKQSNLVIAPTHSEPPLHRWLTYWSRRYTVRTLWTLVMREDLPYFTNTRRPCGLDSTCRIMRRVQFSAAFDWRMSCLTMPPLKATGVNST